MRRSGITRPDSGRRIPHERSPEAVSRPLSLLTTNETSANLVLLMESAARRRFLGVLAGAGVVAAAEGGAAFLAQSRHADRYKADVWRHSDRFDLPPPAGQDRDVPLLCRACVAGGRGMAPRNHRPGCFDLGARGGVVLGLSCFPWDLVPARRRQETHLELPRLAKAASGSRRP